MRILWVKADKLLPVQNGGNIRTFHVLRYLSARHELTFYSYYGGAPDPDYERELQKKLPGAVSVNTGKRELSGAARGLDYLAHLRAQPPYAVSRFAHAKVQKQIQTWFREQRFDVAVCDFLDAAVNFPGKLSIPSVLFQHNVESEIWRRHAAMAGNPAKKMLYAMEFRKMFRYERAIVCKFQHVIAVSDNDRRILAQWVDGDRITVVPTGVDLAEYRPGPAETDKMATDSSSASAPLLTFVGAMDWEPNIDGIEYFCSEVWPLITAEVPRARLRIVGRNPDRRVQKWASSADARSIDDPSIGDHSVDHHSVDHHSIDHHSIEVTGRVPSVVEHLRQSAVVIVPLRIGGGTRLKIYEAMATGKAVVSTTVGAEGLDVQHGRDIILADDPGSFAQAVIMLLRDPELRRRYEKAAAETAARYDWPAIGESFSNVLQSVAEKKSRAVRVLPARLAEKKA
jgi:glycosyltransferase involved in cell wall biosynthesis